MTLLGLVSSRAAVNITGQEGWFESACVTWTPGDGLEYNVYVSEAQQETWTQLDDELLRSYGTYYRADAIGLKAGTYRFRVVPVSDGQEMTGEASESDAVVVKAHDRSGFAHVGMAGGIGAYKNDGTLKDGAKVIYVWADNAKTITHDVVTNNKGGVTTGKGLQDIVYLYQKGYDTTPLAIRIIGTIKAADMDRFDSSAEGLQLKGKSAFANMPITLEGVGNDAAIWGFGILCRNCSNVEFRNFAIMLCMDDCLSLDTDNRNIWIHNMDFFYGNTGGDADQAKGDGTVDIKGKSTHVTVSYNHFVDCGKTSLGGMKSETTDCWMTFHHNWFDHSDSRHPRIRTAFYHVYNNYFDGVSKYGVGVTMGGSAFVENNYFRNTKYPMLISKQGTDAEGDGTFSGENGGVIKAYNNNIDNARKVQYWSAEVQATGAWDAVLVNSRDAAVTATALAGGTGYNTAADQAARTSYIENNIDNPAQVKDIVKGQYGAGRMQHGDFHWAFDNKVQDTNYGVISALKQALKDYRSTLVGFVGGGGVSNGGNSQPVSGGDGQGISDDDNDNYEPSWGGGSGGGQAGTAGEYVIGSSSDYFWFNADNDAAYKAYIANQTFVTDGSYTPAQVVAKSDGTKCSDYIGSVRLSKNQSFTVYCADGINVVSFYVSSTGTQNWKLESSEDGSNWKAEDPVTGKSAEHPTCAIKGTTGVKYARITNTNDGNRDVQGVKVAKPGNGSLDDDEDPADDEPALNSDASAEFLLGGEDIAMSGNAYTLHVDFDAADANGYNVAVTPAEGATVASTTGAAGSDGNYTIAAPAAGQTATATFRIQAENQTDTRTYTISIVKGIDPATLPQTTGEFLYFPEGSKTYNAFFTVSGNTSDQYGSTTYTRNGETYQCSFTLKMELKTSVTFIPAHDGIVRIALSSSGNNNLELDGTKLTGDANNVVESAVKGGKQYTVAKADKAYVYYIELVYGSQTETADVTTAASGFTTLVCAAALDFTTANGLKAYIATGVEGDAVRLAEVQSAPAATPLILKGEASHTYSVGTTNAPAALPGNNLLEGSATASKVLAANEAYILVDGKLHPNEAGTMPAGKAYLPAGLVNGSRVLTLDFGGVTAVSGLSVAAPASSIYTLGGQQKKTRTGKGVYIVDGKKTFLK